MDCYQGFLFQFFDIEILISLSKNLTKLTYLHNEKQKKIKIFIILYIKATVVVSVCYRVVYSAQPCHSFYVRTVWASRGGEGNGQPDSAQTVGFGKRDSENGRPDRAGRGRGQGKVHMSVCLARQGRGQGRAGRAGAK